MTIQVRQKLVLSSKYDIKCPYSMDAEYITLHNTFNDASADREVTYMITNNDQVSFHFAVDDIEVVQGIPVDRNSWNAGDGGKGTGNRKSISVEVCYSKSGGDKYKKAEALAIKFIAQLLYEHKWEVDKVKPHKNWSGKNCPHRILDEGRLDDVLKAIDAELKKLNTPVVQPKVEVKSQPVTPTKPVAQPKKEEYKPVSKPAPKKKYVVLPANATSWAVYPLDKAPVKKNAKAYLSPKKFNGLTYEVLGNPQADVYTIQTDSFGKVNVYAAPSTGAKIVLK